MGLFKRLCSAFASSAEDAMPVTNNTNNIETPQPVAEKTTSALSNDSMVQPYFHNGNAELTVNPMELIIVIKDGNIADLYPTGTHTLDDTKSANLTNGTAYTLSLRESDKVKWSTVNPISFTDSKYGVLSLRARGAFSYKLIDPARFVDEYIIAGSNISIDDYAKNIFDNSIETAIQNCNIASYLELQSPKFCRAIENELQCPVFNYKVNIEMIKLTEESQKAIEQAMMNNL